MLVVDAATDQAMLQAAYGPGLGEVGHAWQADQAFLALLEAAG